MMTSGVENTLNCKTFESKKVVYDKILKVIKANVCTRRKIGRKIIGMSKFLF